MYMPYNRHVFIHNKEQTDERASHTQVCAKRVDTLCATRRQGVLSIAVHTGRRPLVETTEVRA